VTYRAVIFDLDGTLLDTLEDLADSMNASLAACSLPQHPVEAYRLFVGDGVENLVIRAAPAASGDPSLKTALLLRMRSEYQRRWADKSRPYPGIESLLNELSNRDIPMAVLSNKPHDFTLLCATRLLPHHTFTIVQGIDQNTPAKPNPSGALAIAEKLAIPPTAFAYLGDTNTDMQTANAASMFAVGAQWGFRTQQELVDAGAQALIDEPKQLLRWF
jgi:phosphoglycolate phosphatase